MIHQTVKLPRPEWDGFLDWVDDLEYGKLFLLGPPRPDLILFLDMPVDAVTKLMACRDQGDMARRDIHEERRLSARLLRSGTMPATSSGGQGSAAQKTACPGRWRTSMQKY